MQKSFIFSTLILISASLFSKGQSEAVTNYIDQYKWIAIQQMQEYRIPASITLAQGIIESGAGMSELARESNNHFGIKCHSDWKGDKVYYDDDAKDECFRKYKEVEDSYIDHSIFLAAGKRYQSLFELDADDYKNWAKGLKAAGYATNPKYADLLIDIIEKYQLYEYDKMDLADIKKEKKPKKKNPEENVNEHTDDAYFSWRGYKSTVFYFNRIPTIKIKENDTPEKIAKEHEKKIDLLLAYNDLKEGEALVAGTSFYLQPKRKKGTEKYHIVKAHESMWTISRDEGVLLNQLYEKNLLEIGEEPAEGEQVYLRKKRKQKPKLATSVIQKSNAETTNQDKKEQFFMDEEMDKQIENASTEKKEIIESTIEVKDIPIEESQKKKTQNQIEVYHLVQAQETLYGISKKYQVTIEQIQKWNKMQNNTIYVGQKLIVGYD